ncbi:unnamed protein product [Durusdinium trenchii]|uniref:Cytosine-specific methyltransferase n=1 Tax=Durusdinium trenchii TaxID=1381693 RepID=A0ABP0LLX3_9DINO
MLRKHRLLRPCLWFPVWAFHLRAFMGTTLGGASKPHSPRGEGVTRRAGLVLVPQLVESCYQALAESNCIPRKWHPEGRYGIPIERIDCGDFAGKRFIPLLPGAADRLPQEIQELLKAQKALVVSLNSTKMARNGIEWQPGRDKPVAPPIDARTASIPRLDEEIKVPRFGFAELFAGLGGFRVALEALGGECRFASEIERFTRQMYELNFGATSPPVAGDIREVPDADLPEVDLLVAGFPCQPFSALGSQPAFEDDKGLLFREIVRVLNASKAKSFLLENVPGLLDCDGGRALQQIQHELQTVGLHDGQPGYAVHVRTANARNLTAQSRKRVFFFGFRKDLEAAQKPFTLPFIPELQLRAGDIFEPESKELDIYELSEEHFEGLKESQKWARRGGMTDTLAWEEKVCNTLVAHYGTSPPDEEMRAVLVGRAWLVSFSLRRRSVGQNPKVITCS